MLAWSCSDSVQVIRMRSFPRVRPWPWQLKFHPLGNPKKFWRGCAYRRGEKQKSLNKHRGHLNYWMFLPCSLSVSASNWRRRLLIEEPSTKNPKNWQKVFAPRRFCCCFDFLQRNIHHHYSYLCHRHHHINHYSIYPST